MLLIISGTPGVGKSSVAKELSKKLNAKLVDLEKIAKENNIVVTYDKKAKSYVVDESKLTKVIKKQIKDGNYIIPSHLSHFISPKIVDLCVVLRCNPKELEKRLKKRKYSKEKIKENILAEILDVCLIEAVEIGHKVHEINTTNKKISEIVDEIIKVLKKRKKRKIGVVKWLQEYQDFKKYLETSR
ncbi:MAG: adenylate kinase family protein [Nanoarchaeota archaeon]|nr:adenylate kinase family protein [Nanoarchaeota archaeon]